MEEKSNNHTNEMIQSAYDILVSCFMGTWLALIMIIVILIVVLMVNYDAIKANNKKIDQIIKIQNQCNKE